MLWAPILPPRPQLLKQHMIRLAFASLGQSTRMILVVMNYDRGQRYNKYTVYESFTTYHFFVVEGKTAISRKILLFSSALNTQ